MKHGTCCGQAVNGVAFHPNGQVLASCSDDQTIKLYDLTRPGGKRGFRALFDGNSVNSIAFHPSGDFLAAATTDPSLHIYDLLRGSCYTLQRTDQPEGHHQGVLQQVIRNHSPYACWLITRVYVGGICTKRPTPGYSIAGWRCPSVGWSVGAMHTRI